MTSRSTLKSPPAHDHPARRGLTVVEIVAVVGIIALLMGILLPALTVAYGNSRWASSQSNLRQINLLMQEYTSDNRETIVPAAFDYFENSFPGKVRSLDPPAATFPLAELGQRPNYGTWSDLLWTYAKSGPAPPVGGEIGPSVYTYQYDSPDRVFYDNGGFSTADIFRSTVGMTQTPNGTEALPFGTGARASEVGDPGYFAANLLFDARPRDATGVPYVNDYGDWRTSAEVRRPSQTVYLVDSWHGEVIEPTAQGFGSPDSDFGSGEDFEGQVDFRYPGETCLMLFLDGHIGTEERWDDFTDLQNLRNIVVDQL